jgi:hypothetical protein
VRLKADTALGGSDDEADAAMASQIALRLCAAARRKRSAHEFIVRLDRDGALWLASVRIPLEELFTYPANYSSELRAVFTIAAACRAVLRPRGRPKLTKSQLVAQTDPTFGLDERHRKRLKRQLRYELALENWIARGNSVLGGGEPVPEK